MAVRMAEIDVAFAEEMEKGWSEGPRPAMRQIRTRLRKLRPTWVMYALVIVLVLGVTFTTLTLLGPTVGNVFSGQVMSSGSGVLRWGRQSTAARIVR